MGQKHIFYFKIFQFRHPAQSKGMHCWPGRTSNNDCLPIFRVSHLSSSRHLAWLRMSEIHFPQQQSNFRGALGFLPLQTAGGEDRWRIIYIVSALLCLCKQHEEELESWEWMCSDNWFLVVREQSLWDWFLSKWSAIMTDVQTNQIKPHCMPKH